MMDVLRRLGGDIKKESSAVRIDTTGVQLFEAPYDLLRTMRASFLVMGPLLARYHRAKVSLPGGCAIGARPVDIHLKGFKAMGAKIDISHGYIQAQAPAGGLKGCHIHLDIPSVGATENLICAASLARGTTKISNAAREPEIIDLANYINAMGGKISCAGSDTVLIEGVDSLSSGKYSVCPDRIEVATYMAAAAITRGHILIKKTVPEHVASITEKLVEAGCTIKIEGSSIDVTGPERLNAIDVTTQVYPGFPTDAQAQFMAILSIADGVSSIAERVFENRFMHVPELKRMGADITIKGNTAIIKGKPILSGAPVMASDLRAGAGLVLAALAAEGETEILRVYHIDRGYDKLEKRLSNLGASIKRLKK
jgi:UDP-N-acetylglucosamine 1-carboxyvinyltransferase